MFKKISTKLSKIALIVLFLMPFSVEAVVKKNVSNSVRQDLQGRFVIQQENYNKLWYFDPQNKERYLIRNEDDIKLLIELFSVDISNSDFNKISKNSKIKSNSKVVAKYKGKFIKFKDKVYYVNPGDGLAYYINDAQSFIRTAKILGVKVNDNSIKLLSLNNKQLTYDPLNSNLAYTIYDGVDFFESYNSNQVLPLASLTKLMTALVFVETNPDWDKIVEITPEQIAYPCTLQACGTTSEIPLKAGDKVRIEDLWIALLTASSNQSAKILADNSGLTTEQFVAKMNQKAIDLGLTKTKFVEMSGLSPDNISTAEEFAKLAKVAFDNFFINLGTNYRNYSFTVEQPDGLLRKINVTNRNYSLLNFEPQASKTGFLTEAQRNVVLKKDNKIIVVLHALSMNERNEVITKLISKNKLVDAQ